MFSLRVEAIANTKCQHALFMTSCFKAYIEQGSFRLTNSPGELGICKPLAARLPGSPPSDLKLAKS